MADLTYTAANVLQSSGAVVREGIAEAATTIAAGQPVAIASNYVVLAEADNTTLANRTPVGIAVTGAAPGQKVLYCTEDATFKHGLTGVLAGDTLYLSKTAGRITSTLSDLAASTAYVSVLGVAHDATYMNLRLSACTSATAAKA